MEEKKIEINTLTSKEDKQKFKDSINKTKEEIAQDFINGGELPLWASYNAVSKFKSVRRAIVRGKVDLYTGIAFPNKPFNNRKATKGRNFNGLKKELYGQYKRAVQ